MHIGYNFFLCGFLGCIGEGFAVNGVVVRRHGISLGQMHPGHAFGILMAMRAGRRDVVAVDGGFGVAGI